MGNVNVVGPQEALVVSGAWCGGKSQKYEIGGWAWSWWCVSQVDKLSLRVMTLKPTCESVETSQGVPLTVTGVAQVRVMTHSEGKKFKNSPLQRAFENFVGRKMNEIRYVIEQTLAGHLRSILGQLTVQEIFQDREKFAEQVRQIALGDLGRMGIELISFRG